MLFCINDRERAKGLCTLFCGAIIKGSPNNDAMESAFHLFWDCNIRDIMEALIPDGTSIRDSNRHTSTCAQRPDFGFLYLNVCPFRGGEKSLTNLEDSQI